MDTINTLTSGAAFSVRKLEELSKLELETGQYLVRKIEKGTGKESKGVVIPAASSEDMLVAMENDTLLGFLTGQYQELIASVCKGKIAEGTSYITANDYSLAELVAFVQAEDAREGRISKARLESWFDQSVAGVLIAAFRAKLGVGVSNDKLLELSAVYKAQFATLAKRELTVGAEVKAKLEKVLELVPDSPMVQYCRVKMATEAKTVEMLGL